MKRCDVCNKEELIQYRVKSINYKNWIFCCTKCWHIVSKQDQYAYGGTRKSKKSEEIRKDELNLSEKHQIERAAVWQEVIDNHKKIKEGFIYILSNPRIAGTYKIGFVKEDVEKRALCSNTCLLNFHSHRKLSFLFRLVPFSSRQSSRIK